MTAVDPKILYILIIQKSPLSMSRIIAKYYAMNLVKRPKALCIRSRESRKEIANRHKEKYILKY